MIRYLKNTYDEDKNINKSNRINFGEGPSPSGLTPVASDYDSNDEI